MLSSFDSFLHRGFVALVLAQFVQDFTILVSVAAFSRRPSRLLLLLWLCWTLGPAFPIKGMHASRDDRCSHRLRKQTRGSMPSPRYERTRKKNEVQREREREREKENLFIARGGRVSARRVALAASSPGRRRKRERERATREQTNSNVKEAHGGESQSFHCSKTMASPSASRTGPNCGGRTSSTPVSCTMTSTTCSNDMSGGLPPL